MHAIPLLASATRPPHRGSQHSSRSSSHGCSFPLDVASWDASSLAADQGGLEVAPSYPPFGVHLEGCTPRPLAAASGSWSGMPQGPWDSPGGTSRSACTPARLVA